MKVSNLLMTLGILATAGAAGSAQASSSRQYMKPCESWMIDPAGYGRVCSLVGLGGYYYDAPSVDQIVARLEAKIQQLEERVADLEDGAR